MHPLLINFLSLLIDLLIDIASLLMAFVIQKVVFLESHTWKQFMTYLKLVMIMVALLLCLFAIPPTIRQQEFFSTYVIPTLVMASVFIPFFYCAYTGRKRYKWLAFFEFIPIMGCIDGVRGVIDLFIEQIPDKNIQDLINLGINLAIVLLFGYLAWKQPPFVSNLIRDVKRRTLTIGEEVIVWVVGIWLFVYSAIIKDYLVSTTTFNVVVYVSFLNCICAAVIIAYVINSNYRDFYYKKNERLQKSLISAMAELVENRDENTGGHIQRTSRYVEIIARKLQRQGKFANILTDKYIEDMVIAAPLHDIGKIHIPDSILNKPGKLDAKEFDTMKTHSAAGGTIISHIETNTGEIAYLKVAREMAEYHHERMDGKGYPHGLAGNEIPLCARILAVADVFDAVSSKRCYKEAFSLDKSFAIIEEEMGSHFDEDVARAFLDSREEVEDCFHIT